VSESVNLFVGWLVGWLVGGLVGQSFSRWMTSDMHSPNMPDMFHIILF
jgi:hypothetical protein